MRRIGARLRKLESDLRRIEQQRDETLIVVEDPNWYGNAERLAEVGARQIEDVSRITGWYGE